MSQSSGQSGSVGSPGNGGTAGSASNPGMGGNATLIVGREGGDGRSGSAGSAGNGGTAGSAGNPGMGGNATLIVGNVGKLQLLMAISPRQHWLVRFLGLALAARVVVTVDQMAQVLWRGYVRHTMR